MATITPTATRAMESTTIHAMTLLSTGTHSHCACGYLDRGH